LRNAIWYVLIVIGLVLLEDYAEDNILSVVWEAATHGNVFDLLDRVPEVDDARRDMNNAFTEYGLWGWNYWYLLTHPWKIVEESYYHTKWFIQRGWRGYADCDVWALDYYLAGWMAAALRVLETTKIGHPCGMTQKGWRTRLRIMREGFEAAKSMDRIPVKEEYKRLKRKMDRGLCMFAKHYLSLWD
jgi:hypothetical protein